jgi:diguanylate cyclase (GGDEF)-like protein
VPILFIALRYGRQTGFLAATGGALIYLIAKSQELNTLDFQTQDGWLILARALLFGLVGIFGSELASRAKYLLANFAGEDQIDKQTHLYTRTYIQDLLTRLLDEYRRYGRPFSILFVTLDWAKPPEAVGRQKFVGKIANIIRSNLRLIDNVGYISDNSFCLILPETPVDSAYNIFKRIEKVYALQTSLPAEPPSMVCQRVLGMPENEAEIRAILPRSAAESFKI